MERIMVIFCIVLITSVNSLESKITKIHPLKYNTKALKILAEKFNAPSTFKSYVNPLLIPRVTDSLGIDQAKKFIIKVLKNLNWNVEIDEFQKTTPYGSKTFRNIIATYNTTKPKRLVLAAHYDSKDLSKDGKHFIGATDAAVPCAILLDVVTQLKCLMARGNGRLMPFQIRSSKFRHVYGSPFRKEKCFENVRITRNAHDSNFCAVNPKYLAVVVESAGGGSFLCLPTNCPGRVDVTAPKISGHAGNVLDIKWSPFSDHIIASCSDDNTVKVWQVPEDGLRTNLTAWLVDLHGHTRRVTYIEWHPTAENVLLSTSMDFKCVLWNIEQAEPINIINCHSDTVFSMSWNRDGSLMATTCKDRKIRIIDPRKGGVAVETNGHVGNKASKVIYMGDASKVFTTGFDRMSNRQCALWDVKNMKTPIRLLDIDSSSGVILPYYDFDSRMVYLAGKGDGNIRYYEIEDDNEAIHFLNVYQSPVPQRGFGVMPKRGCDVTKCEVMRFYKMQAAKDMVEPISMIAPRKSHKFHDDLFPPTASMIPSLSADEWISGQNRDPILMSLLDGHITNSPKYSSAHAVQVQDGSISLPPTITTYKAMNPLNNNEPIARTTNNMVQSVGGLRDSRKEPASLKNIKRLSTNEDFVSINEENDSNGKPVPPLDLDKDKPMTDQNQNERKTVKKVWTPTTPTNEVTTNGFSGPDSDQMMILLDLIGSSDIHFQSLSKATKPYFEGLVKIEKKLADAGFLNKEGLSRNRTLFHLNRYGHQYYEGIQDDHTPFLARNVTVLPLISVPYPSVWHKVADNKKAIDYAVTDNFNKIFRVFVASFLHLDPTDSACSSKNK